MRFKRFLSFLSGWLLLAGTGSFAAGIHTAVMSGDADKIAAELVRDASMLNQPDADGNTPLHLAVEKKNTKIVRLLLSKGADPILRDHAGKTPLRKTIDANFPEGFDLLITQGGAGYEEPLLDVRQKEGVAALKDGTLAKANEMLGRLVRLDPANENINFAYGLSWLSLGDPAPAGMAFERVLQVNSGNNRARLELARARLAAKRYPEARKELEIVLASDLPADVQQTVTACLREVKAHMTRWYYSGHVELGGLYDDNVNVGPDSKAISIAPLTIFGTRITELLLSDNSDPRNTTGIYLSADARAFFDIGDPNGWFLTTDANGYANRLEENDYETGNVQAGIGLRRMFNRGFLQVPFRARYVEYGGEALVWIYGLYPSMVYSPASLNGVSFTTTPTLEKREFDTLANRDGTYLSLSQTVRKSFARGRYGLYGGGEVQSDHTDSPEFEYTGAGLFAGGDARLPGRFHMFGEARYIYRNYEGRNILAPEDRTDYQRQFSAGLSHNLSSQWAILLTHNIIRNDSSFDLYEYKRQITTLSTSVKF